MATAACAAVIAAVAQPEPALVHVPAIDAQHGSGAEGSAPAYAARSDLAPEQALDGGTRPAPTVRLRSIAPRSLLDSPAQADARASHPGPASPALATSKRPSTAGSAGGAASAQTGAAGGAPDGDGPEGVAGGTAGAAATEPGGGTGSTRSSITSAPP